MGKSKSGKANSGDLVYDPKSKTSVIPSVAPKTIQPKHQYQRLNYLYQLSTILTVEKHPELARICAKNMVQISQKTVTKMKPSIKRKLCKKCNSVLIPGINCQVRLLNYEAKDSGNSKGSKIEKNENNCHGEISKKINTSVSGSTNDDEFNNRGSTTTMDDDGDDDGGGGDDSKPKITTTQEDNGNSPNETIEEISTVFKLPKSACLQITCLGCNTIARRYPVGKNIEYKLWHDDPEYCLDVN
ncbi:ribonuclease P protein subunit [Saccharomycopsis crataegensis]|uniref:Ribonuclease P protein subunit n=1 Tax=Saccharomycopsis crataegensis TaxID=43959 RepID=A0AAV5QJF5_9ASCO|nr:ribonuclease P protein subunit [Saccharomycopsis crataegensis]